MSSVEHAANANEAIRSLIHVTLSTASGDNVADVYTVLGELAQLGHRLEQTARQLSQILEARRRVDGLHLADEETRHTTASDAIDAAVPPSPSPPSPANTSGSTSKQPKQHSHGSATRSPPPNRDATTPSPHSGPIAGSPAQQLPDIARQRRQPNRCNRQRNGAVEEQVDHPCWIMATVERMHYIQAAHIGLFGTGPDDRRRRSRKVWVARRGANAPFRVAADKVGFDSAHPAMYAVSGEPDPLIVDRVWQAAEDRIGPVERAVRDIVRGEPVDSQTFVWAIVPYLAQILARSPVLTLEETSDLRATPNDARLLRERADLFFVYVNALLYNRRWSVIEAPPGDFFVGTDFGWLWLPGPGPGLLFVPFGPRVAFVIERATPSYHPGDADVRFGAFNCAADDCEQARIAMALEAPKDVYASSRGEVEFALDVWSDHSRGVLPTGWGILGVSHASQRQAAALRTDAATDPELSRGRMMLATHQWPPCTCRDSALAQGATAKQADDYVAYTERVMARAKSSLVHGDRHRPPPSAIASPFPVVRTRSRDEFGPADPEPGSVFYIPRDM